MTNKVVTNVLVNDDFFKVFSLFVSVSSILLILKSKRATPAFLMLIPVLLFLIQIIYKKDQYGYFKRFLSKTPQWRRGEISVDSSMEPCEYRSNIRDSHVIQKIKSENIANRGGEVMLPERTVRTTEKLPEWGVGAPMFSLRDGLKLDKKTRSGVKRGKALYVRGGLNALELPPHHERINEGELSMVMKPFSTAVKDSTDPYIFKSTSKPGYIRFHSFVKNIDITSNIDFSFNRGKKDNNNIL